MMQDGPGEVDERYVRYREFAALEKDHASLKARIEHVPGELSRLTRAHEGVEGAVKELSRVIESLQRQPPQSDQLALSLHNLAESLRKPVQAAPATPPFPFSIATIATTAGGLLLLGALMGQAIGVDRLMGVGP